MQRRYISVSIGENVKRVREERGLSQTEVARRCGVAQPSIWGLERGEFNPSAPLLVKLSKALDVSTDELLAEDSSVPLARAHKKLEDPDVIQWLIDNGAAIAMMDDEDYFSLVIEADLESLAQELDAERSRIIGMLERPAVWKKLFPSNVAAFVAKEERLKEAKRPSREASGLRRELRSEYRFKERALDAYAEHHSEDDLREALAAGAA
jgi:transcriptional regulator with XRE-family HTH domain